ncbi:enolase C-terminal domain-like protein [Flavobacterium sp. H122]|uniref:enolase C-terminal domain-like protein n=1 Tax=Flavobacterium sp. H122 TaxID=2529860 RepID=UPI0010AA0120|nr:enolase C-terminal domain-like protein [Flavobacterium sp. H122]
MKLTWQKVKLPLKETFSISYGDYSFREALIVTLEYKGFLGYGECTAIDYYGIDLDDLINQLTRSKALIENQQITEPQHFYFNVNKMHLSSFITSALDCAYWDLYGKLENRSFLELNKIDFRSIPESSITISIATAEEQIKKIEKSSWNKFKVKCKGLDKESFYKLSDLGKDIALDSNASFTLEDCRWIQNQKSASKFTYLEQPMPVKNFTGLSRDKFANWMADEDFQNENNLVSLHSYYRSINIKLVKCGGLTPALNIIKEARKLNYKIMIGCMTESTVGISAGAVLAPLADYCDLDGANLIAQEIACGSQIINGKIEISEKPGLGIKLL